MIFDTAGKFMSLTILLYPVSALHLPVLQKQRELRRFTVYCLLAALSLASLWEAHHGRGALHQGLQLQQGFQ